MKGLGTLELDQELQSSVGGVEVGLGTCKQVVSGLRVRMEDRKDRVTHLSESLPGVATGGSK